MDKNKDALQIYNKKNKKDNRWDKIRKKYNNSVHITSDTVKKFLNLNLINRNELQLLNGVKTNISMLDPNVVMEMRHNSISRKSIQDIEKISPSLEATKILQTEKREQHKKSLENVAIDNELKKFKNELMKIKTTETRRQTTTTIRNHDFSINNQILYENILRFEFATKDFYRTCAKAPLLIIDSSEENMITNKKQDTATRMVRFEETIKIVNYQSEEQFDTNDSDEVIKCMSIFNETDTTECEDCGDQDTSEDVSYCSIFHDDRSSSVSEISDEENELNCENSKFFVESIPKKKQSSIQTDDPTNCLVVSCINLEKPNISLEEDNNLKSEQINESNEENTEREKIITDLFKDKYYKATSEYELKILRRYFQKWSVITSLEKITGKCMINKESRVAKINEFLNKVREEKKLLKENQEGQNVIKHAKTINSIMMSKKYQQKLKHQQEVIDLQKLKLQRQERMITELKLSKMFEESKISKTEIKTELQNFIRHGAVKIRARAKCLQIVSNLRDEEIEEEEFKNLQASGNQIPKFLIKMQARAVERHTRHEEAKEKRERLEKEKEAAKLAAEEAKRMEDEIAKRERYEALREKRRLEKLEKIQKEKDRQKYLEDTRKANEFRRFKLLKTYGFDQFKKLILIKKMNERKARQFRKRMLIKNVFYAWDKYTKIIWEKKKKKADEFYLKYLEKVAYRMWKNAYLIFQSKYLVACDLYDFRLTEKAFNEWSAITKQFKLVEELKIRQAESHYNWHLKWKALEHWQRLHIILKIEKETEERRQRWRIKIWELLPDYEPAKE